MTPAPVMEQHYPDYAGIDLRLLHAATREDEPVVFVWRPTWYVIVALALLVDTAIGMVVYGAGKALGWW